MKIEVIKHTFDGETQYKYKPFEYCCEELKRNDYINLEYEYDNYCNLCEKEDCINCKYDLDDTGRKLAMMIRYDDTHPEPWENYYTTDTYLFPIKFCPFCGEPIEIVCVGEVDKTEEYLKLCSLLDNIRKDIRKTDSKKKEAELTKVERELRYKVEEFHYLSEYKEVNAK